MRRSCALPFVLVAMHCAASVAAQEVGVCHGTSAAQMRTAIAELDATVRRGEDGRGALRTLLQSPCMALAAENTRPIPLDSSRALESWWTRGGATWVRSLLDDDEIVLPPDVLPPYRADRTREPGWATLLCADDDVACGEATRSWLTRAAEALATAVPPRRSRADASGRCERAARGVATSQRYASWRACLEGERSTSDALPLGALREPARGWLVVSGRRGHHAFCDQVALFDLVSGSAHVARSCSSLVLRHDGTVDVEATDAARHEIVERGRVPLHVLREAMLALLLPSRIVRLQTTAQTFVRPRAFPRRWTPLTAPPRAPARWGGGGVSTADDLLRWSWIDEGKVLAEGQVSSSTASSNALGRHATELVERTLASVNGDRPSADVPRGVERTDPVERALLERLEDTTPARTDIKIIESDRCWAIFDQVYFARGSVAVPAHAIPFLRGIVELLDRCETEYPTLTLRGGADPSEKDATLAQRRAEAVRQRLVELGAAPERLRVAPEPELAKACRDERCRARNQRVAIDAPPRPPGQ